MLAALLAVSLLQPLPAQGPRTLYAGEGRPYATPAAALAAARDGDTVRVAAGVHRGPLLLDRHVVLRGDRGAILDGGGLGSTVTVTADSVEVAGLTIRESGRSLDTDDAAVKVVRARGCAVRGLRIERSLHGVYLLEADGAVVSGNDIEGDTALAEARRGNAVHLFNAHGTTVERNRIRHARDGIYFAGANRNLIAGNDVAHVRYGVHYMYSDDNEFRGNTLHRNAAGAAIMSSRRIVFRENVFRDHVGYRAYGILLQSADAVTAERNRIEGNLVGLFVDASMGGVFRDNVIAGNGIGIDLTASAEGSLFAGNRLDRNRTPVRRLLGAGENRWAEDGRGNYWGDPAVFDLDGDGVGERPYRAGDAFSTLAAERPVLEVFTGTPAARALSWAEEAFPVFGTPRVVDPRPLAAPPLAGPPPEPGTAPDGPARARFTLLLLLPLALVVARRRAGRKLPR
jgi:nitrous oxidase accessory protein